MLSTYLFNYCINISYMESGDQFPFKDRFDWNNKVFLGEGSYGQVFKAKNIKDGQFYAIKQMKMEEFNHDPMLMESLKGEITITMDVNSQHTVKMIEAKIGKIYTYIILEICDNDLRKELASRKFTQEDCVHAFEEIMQGFSVLVSKGYIHRDIKPANVLVKNKHYKVADFGFACKADIFGKKKLTDICGTPIYMAPQLLKNQPYTAKSDIWSLGLMFYQMIFGYPPWPCRSLQEYLSGICSKPLSFPYNAVIGENTKDFLKKSLVVDEDKRMDWDEVFKHPLIKGKQVGKNIQEVKIDPYCREIMLKLQAALLKQQEKWSYYINTYSQLVMNFDTFKRLLREIDSSITSHQVQIVFNYIDKQHLKILNWKALEFFLIKIDYRDSQDIFSRKIDQIVAILKERKADPIKIFDQIDLNHSGSLDFNEFTRFIFAIAPRYTKPEILQIYKLFDNDKNGLISKQEFLQLITKKMPSQKLHSQHSIQRERATRNITQLKNYIKWKGMSSEVVLNLADQNHTATLQFEEFQDLVINKLKFKISPDEVEELFAFINTHKNDNITLAELKDALL